MREIDKEIANTSGCTPIIFGEDNVDHSEERIKELWGTIGQGLL
jgi:hypothetical protein